MNKKSISIPFDGFYESFADHYIDCAENNFLDNQNDADYMKAEGYTKPLECDSLEIDHAKIFPEFAKLYAAEFVEYLHNELGVAIALDWSRDDKTGGVRVGGCGMDMGFHLVYQLGSVLWPKGTKKPHGKRNGEPDYSGGYALKHEWL